MLPGIDSGLDPKCAAHRILLETILDFFGQVLPADISILVIPYENQLLRVNRQYLKITNSKMHV